MIRDLDALTARTFDVVIVGGGIYGLTIAYDAAQRGLSVALVERDDFGGGASFNHLRTIHGGLRYLQTLDLARARESVAERRALATIAPHTLQPLPFALPLYRSLTRGAWAMRAGFLLDRIVAFDRNRGVPRTLRLPAGRVVSKEESVDRFPGLARRGLTGAAVWYDYVATEADRLTFSFALAAAANGATMVNHVEATALLQDGRHVIGVQARDRAAAREVAVHGRLVVNATGARVDGLLTPVRSSARIPMLKVMNLVTRRDAGAAALGGRSPSGRNLFLVPWRGRALFGTWESGRLCPPDDRHVANADVLAFIAELNQTFPSLDLVPADVTLVHRGIVPAATAKSQVSLEGHEQIRDHAGEGLEGLVSVVGAKYTTARRVAEQVTNRLFSMLGRPRVACRTATVPLPGGDLSDSALAVAQARRAAQVELPGDAIPHLVAAYGSGYRAILDVCAEQADLRTRLADASPVVGAEIAWAARAEMAVTLTDAVVRRTPLGALGYPGDGAALSAAHIMARELGWSDQRTIEEMAALKQFYQWDGGVPSTAPETR